jgi:hypothetical protein
MPCEQEVSTIPQGTVDDSPTDSSIRAVRFFLYRRAVLMFIVDFLFGWTDGRLSDIKVWRAVPRPRRPEPSAAPSAWSGSMSTSV